MAKKVIVKQTEPLKLEVRVGRGSRASQRLRAEGKVPGIIYGLGKDPVAITASLPETTGLIHSGTHTADIDLDGKVDKVLIQDVQYNYLQTEIEHVDFLRIDPNQRVDVKVALDFRGTPKGAKEGGVLETPLSVLEINVLATAIPDSIRVVVDDLALHASIHAKDVKLPEGAKLVTSPEAIVATVRTVKEEEVAPAAEAGPSEPEVIGKKKEEEGAEGDAAAAGKAAPAAKAPAKK